MSNVVLAVWWSAHGNGLRKYVTRSTSTRRYHFALSLSRLCLRSLCCTVCMCLYWRPYATFEMRAQRVSHTSAVPKCHIRNVRSWHRHSRVSIVNARRRFSSLVPLEHRVTPLVLLDQPRHRDARLMYTSFAQTYSLSSLIRVLFHFSAFKRSKISIAFNAVVGIQHFV